MSRPRTGRTRADFEVTARRIRSMAERMLAELPREDMNVVYARRNTMQAEIDQLRTRDKEQTPNDVWPEHDDPRI